MELTFLLSCAGVLLATSAAAVALVRRSVATPLVYALTLTVSTAALGISGWALLAAQPPQTVLLPIGLPWLGAHFRLDPLGALFLVVVNLGSLTASLFGLGDGPHERSPDRVLAFFPAFLAGMNLVVLADDAFTFLLTWEFRRRRPAPGQGPRSGCPEPQRGAMAHWS